MASALLSCSSANAQVIDELALTLPIYLSKHITVGQLQDARVGVYNGCSLPVDIEIHVTPYAPKGAARLGYEPYMIPITVPGEGFQYGDAELRSSAPNGAHADIEIVPAPTQRQTNACFAPGQDLIRATVGVFSAIDGSIRNVYPIKFKRPSNNADTDQADFRPLDDRVVVRYEEEKLVPVNPGDILEFAAANDCSTDQKAKGEILVLNSTDGPMPFSIDLEPGQRELLSIVPVDPGIPPAGEGYWVLVSPLSSGEHALPRCLADSIKVGLIYKPAHARF